MTSNVQILRQDPESHCERIAIGLGSPANASRKEMNDKLLNAKSSKITASHTREMDHERKTSYLETILI
jgi:hypothetical protein